MQVILQGSLRHFPAAELLSFLCSRKQNGTLDLENAGRRTRVLFEGDHIVWAESNRVSDATDAVIDLFAWEGGSFTLLDSCSLPENAQRLGLTLAELQAEAAQRAAGLYRDDTLFRVVENPAQQEVSLSGEEFKILFRLSSGRTVAELAADLGLERKQLEERLKKLEELGLIVSEVPGSSGSPVPRPGNAEDPEEPRGTRGTPPENPFAPKTAPIPALEDAEVTRVERDVIRRNTLTPKTVERKKTLVGSLTPDDRPDAVHPLFDAECVIGRAPDCAINIADGSVSSRHARITRSAEGFTLEDLQSRNGTFVNGEKVDKPRLLADGDVVRLGKIIMTFNVAQETVATPTTQLSNLE